MLFRFLGKSVGLVITASHNPARDNGIKLVDPNGQMLPIDCEKQLTSIVNMTDDEFAEHAEKEIHKLGTHSGEEQVKVIIATDTRPSSPDLLKQAIAGIEILSKNGVGFKLFGW